MPELQKVTAGIDWEVLVNDSKTGCSPGNKKIERLIAEIQTRTPDLEIGEDLELVELRIGVVNSYQELLDRSTRAFEVSRKTAEDQGLVLMPIGYREADMNPAGGHVHAGSIADFRTAVELHNKAIPFVPALIALASSSPSLDRSYMSLRLKGNAGNCSSPVTGMSAEETLPRWGSDVCIKYPYKPTLELRAADSQPTPLLNAEIASLYIGLIARLSRLDKPVFKPDLIQYGLNRINACRNGMRATFIIEGEEITASEMIIEYVIPLAVEGLSYFGTPHGPFELAENMAKKRISVADWVAYCIPVGTDPYVASGELTRIFKAGMDIESWLLSQKECESAPFCGTVDYILDIIGVDTPLGFVQRYTPLPYLYTEKLVDKLVEEGKIKKKLGQKNELLLDRIDLI